MTNKLLPLLIALLFSFSGCLGLFEGDDIENDAGEEDATNNKANGDKMENGDGNETDSGNENQPISAPEASLSADVEEGIAPLNVTLTLDGSDPEGYPLNWSLDMGDDNTTYTGDELPADLDHSFQIAGNYTVVLNVTNGPHYSQANVTVQVAEPAPAVVTQEESGEWLVGAIIMGCFGDIVGAGYPGELDGIGYASFEVDPATYGQEYEAAVETDTAQDSPGFTFLDADREVLAGGFMSDAATGTVPKGAVHGVFWTCLGGLMSGSYATG